MAKPDRSRRRTMGAAKEENGMDLAHIHIWLAAASLHDSGRATFPRQELLAEVKRLFQDERPGDMAYMDSHANASSNKAIPTVYNYLLRVGRGTLRLCRMDDTVHPSRAGAKRWPDQADVDQTYWRLWKKWSQWQAAGGAAQEAAVTVAELPYTPVGADVGHMGPLRATLVENLRALADQYGNVKTSHLWVCSAYVNSGGVRTILPLVARAEIVRAVLGAGDQTEPEAVVELRDHKVDVKLRRLANGEFHPKCYLGLTPDGKAWAAVGSANLTQAGANTNEELMTVLEGDSSHPYFASLLRWFRRQHALGHLPTDEVMAAVTAAFKAGQKAKRDTEQVGTKKELAKLFGRLDEQQRGRSVLTYIHSTRLATSYKLVTLGTLLQAPSGKLDLEECADRILAFYQALKDLGAPSERIRRGNRQLVVAGELDRERVVRLVTGWLDVTIKRRAVVRYWKTTSGVTRLGIDPNLTPEERLDALDALVDRLEEYYRLRVGATVSGQAIREALERAAEGR